MHRNLLYSLLLSVLFLLPSCVPYKSVPYFNNLPMENTGEPVTAAYADPVIQKNDILKITVSSLDPDVTRLFSFNSDERNMSNANSSGSNYLVDPEGYIRMPLIGPVKVDGQTTFHIRDTITALLLPYLKETVVEIRIASFRIAVMGDVLKPGMYSVTNERLSLTDALALAGDLNITARRDNVLLVREENGKRNYIRFNLGSSGFINSPYYYLRSNDLVYVQPGKVATRDVNFRNLTYLATLISLVALVATILK